MTEFILMSFLIWRTGLSLFSYFGSTLLEFSPRFPYSEIFLTSSGLPQWVWSFANFDGVHYLTIAKSGYWAQFTQVFFPIYPLILAVFQRIIPFANSVLISLIVSNLLFMATIISFTKLLSLDYKNDEIKWMVIFLLSFPVSFFFGCLYTESLFLFLVCTSLYFARRKRWWLAGIIGGLASATRLTGIFILPALWWEWHQHKIKVQKSKIKDVSKITKKDSKNLMILNIILSTLHSPVTYLVPLGLIIYMVYLQIYFGDWLYFWHAQPAFGAQRTGNGIILLPQVFWRYFKILLTVNTGSLAFWIPLLEFCSTVFGIVLLIIAHLKKMRMSYLIFSWFILLIPTLTGTLSSMPRYILPAIPIYIVLGSVRSGITKSALLVFSCLLLIVLTVLFTCGYWVS